MPGFFLLQNSLRDPYFQLAWEEALALEMPKFSYQWGVRIWRNTNTIVLGISEKEATTIQPKVLEDFRKNFTRGETDTETISIARRASGGGTVYQDHPGNLNFSMFLDISQNPELYPIPRSYEVLLGIVRSALENQNCLAETAGKSDISITMPDGSLKKISGNAQFRKKNIIVQHGTLILSPELFQKVEEFQLHPPEEPDYRKGRSHKDFITHIPTPISESKLGLDIHKLLGDYLLDKSPKSSPEPKPGTNQDPNPFTAFLRSTIRLAYRLKQDKYASPDWIFRS